MTPAERLAYMLRAADLQYEVNLGAIQSFREIGLMDENTVALEIEAAKAAYDWNIGQAQMDFDLDMGVTKEPPSSRLKAAQKIEGFEGDNGSASNA